MSDKSWDKLKARVKETPLSERLEKCREICSEVFTHKRKPAYMSIPVQAHDEDILVSVTLKDAIELVEAAHEVVRVRTDGFMGIPEQRVELYKAIAILGKALTVEKNQS